MAAQTEAISTQALVLKPRKWPGVLRWLQKAYERVNMPPQALYAEDQRAAHRILKY